MVFLFWPGCRTRGGSHSAMTPTGDVSAHLGTFLRESSCLGVLLRKGWLFWVPTHAYNHLVTHFESVSAFLSYPAPGYPGREPPLESYLSQRRVWGDKGTSRVRLLYTGATTMALKPPLSSLHHYSGFIGTRGLLTASLPPWSFLPMGIGEPHCDRLVLVMFNLGDTLVGRRLHLGDALTLATLPLGDADTWRLFT